MEVEAKSIKRHFHNVDMVKADEHQHQNCHERKGPDVPSLGAVDLGCNPCPVVNRSQIASQRLHRLPRLCLSGADSRTVATVVTDPWVQALVKEFSQAHQYVAGRPPWKGGMISCQIAAQDAAPTVKTTCHVKLSHISELQPAVSGRNHNSLLPLLSDGHSSESRNSCILPRGTIPLRT